MHKKRILRSRKTDARLIEYEVPKGDNKPPGKVHYSESRAELVWAGGGQGGCFTVVNSQWDRHGEVEVLELIMEHRSQELSLERLLNTLAEAYVRYKVSAVYLDFSSPIFTALQDYCTSTGTSIRYRESVYKDDFEFRVIWAKDKVTRKLLLLPSESECWQELVQKVTKADLRNLKSDELAVKFPLAHSLAGVVSSYMSRKVHPVLRWHGPSSGLVGVPGGWMAR